MTKKFLIAVIIVHLVVYGGWFIKEPGVLLNYFDNWSREPVLYTLPVIGYMCFIGLFIAFMGLIEAVGEVCKDADDAVAYSEKVRKDLGYD